MDDNLFILSNMKDTIINQLTEENNKKDKLIELLLLKIELLEILSTKEEIRISDEQLRIHL